MDIVSNIIETTINSFDFGLVVVINVATYILIKIIDDVNTNKKVGTWLKRLIMLCCSICISLIYIVLELGETKLILNSAILAPVFWSWIGKPIVKKLGVDYRDTDDRG